MNGKTTEMVALSRIFAYRKRAEWVQKDRDRSLPGKKRIKARKAARR